MPCLFGSAVQDKPEKARRGDRADRGEKWCWQSRLVASESRSVVATAEDAADVDEVIGDHPDGQRKLHWIPNRI